ncbi:hypothetical protein K2X30_08595 [bacterium]|nr:hypothetical protein [bacterium]
MKAWMIAVLLALGTSSADAALPGSSVADEADQGTPSGPAKLLTSLSVASDFFSDSRHSVATTFSLMPSLRVGENYSLTGRFMLNVPVYGPDKNPGFEDGVISLRRKKLEINPVLSFSPGAGMILPVSRDSAVRRTMLVGLKLSPRLSMDLKRSQAPAALKNLTAFYELSPSFFSHEFQSTVDGRPNTRFALSHILNLEYSLGETGFSLSWTPTLSTSWTYNGVARSRFTMDEAIGYSLNQQLSLAAGISTSGDYLAANGTDTNLSFLDQNRSQFYFSLNAAF